MSNPYRYWALVTNPGAAATGWVYRMELRGVAGGPDLTQTMGSFNVSGPSGGAAVFDNNDATYWNGNSVQAAVIYDFGTSVSLAELYLLMDAANLPANFFLLGSDSIGNWTLEVPPTPVTGAAMTVAIGERASFTMAQHSASKIRWSNETMSTGLRFHEGAKTKGYGQLFGQLGVIAGVVDTLGTPNVPVFRKVRVHDQGSGILLREKWSDPVTGAYRFSNLPLTQPCYVIAFDFQHNFDAVVHDNITPVLQR